MPPSLTRGVKERWWPVGKLPPSVPVTAIRSPAGAVLGRAAAEPPCQPPHAAVNSFHLGDGAVCVHEQGHQCVKGRAAHGPYV